MNYDLLKKYSYIMWSTPVDEINLEALLAECVSGKYTKQEFLNFIEDGTFNPKDLTDKLNDLCGELMSSTKDLPPEDEDLFNYLYEWEEAQDT